MRKKYTIMPFLRTLVIACIFSLQGCGTYNTKTTMEQDLYNGEFAKASTAIDNNRFLKKDRNRLLFLMEKGKVEHLRGNYEASNALLEQAYIMLDDKIQSNVGQTVAANLTNPMSLPYKGEDFEKVTIHYYMALNYFHLGMPNEALVEAKRIDIKLLELNEKYPENKNKYSKDAFSQILQGSIYESTGDINNAFIAYRNAEEIYDKDGGSYLGVAMPMQLKLDLVRTSKQMGFTEDYKKYQTKFDMRPEPVLESAAASVSKKKGKTKKKDEPAKDTTPKPQYSAPYEPIGEAIVFWENGLAPAKDQIILTLSAADHWFYGTYMEDGKVEEIFLPLPIGFDVGTINAVAIPKYRVRETFYSNAAMVIDDKEVFFELGQNFNTVAKQCLKDRMIREIANIITRFAAKKAASAGLGALGKELLGDTGGDLMKLGGDIAGAATEKADTRNWQSLPAKISYMRIQLKEDQTEYTIKKYGPNGIVDTASISIPFKKGLQIVNYYDLGRTQVIPAPPLNTPDATATPDTAPAEAGTITIQQEIKP